MEIATIKQQIKAHQLDKTYIFYGEEYAIIKIYLKLMADSAGLKLTYADSLTDLMTGAKTKSLVSQHHLYVVMDDKEYLTNEKMQERFKGLKDDVVVLYFTTADKRLKFWKNNKDRAVEFPKLTSDILTKYIKKELPLSDENCFRLIEACDSDYGRILLEIDKIKHYMLATESDDMPNNSFEVLMSQRAIYSQPKDAIFDFVGAYLERNPSKTYKLLKESKDCGEANLVIISVLYNNIKTLLQIQSSSNYKSLGLNGFAVKNVIGYRDNYSNGELVKALKLLRNIESGIKKGLISDEMSVDYFLVQTM